MKLFDEWTLELIRNEGSAFSWFEEHRFEWIPSIINAMSQIMDGKTIVLIVDHERGWFGEYITTTLNKKSQNRPMIPIVSLDALYPHYDYISGGESIDVLSDMLDIAFKGEYFFWYIGKGDDKRCDIVKRNANALIWIMDEMFQNALLLHSYDPLLDIKLLQLYILFDKTLSGVLFGDIDVRE